MGSLAKYSASMAVIIVPQTCQSASVHGLNALQTRYRTMATFEIAKVKYTYTVHGKTAKVTREDGAWAKFHDDENCVDDWKTALMEMIADNNLYFSEV